MNRRALLKASVCLPMASYVPTPARRAAQASATLHVTFLYHCAFASWDAGRRTDVILSPSSVHTPHGDGMPAHVATLRIPAQYVLSDSEHPGIDDQGDRIWRLEGYDLSIATDDDPVTRTTRSWEVALEGGTTVTPGAPSTWAIANLDRLVGGPAIDKACVASDPPAFLQRGGRVRLTAGHLGCGLPTTQGLREITWDAGGDRPIGLSDRVDYFKPTGDTVLLMFRQFSEATPRRVMLGTDGNGVIRAFVSNDPLLGGSGCPALSHFRPLLPARTARWTAEADSRTDHSQSFGARGTRRRLVLPMHRWRDARALTRARSPSHPENVVPRSS